ncbi:hypothetical protein AXF42_Ash009263 [Apostasia shenzhenica]|uniref:Uncharacterized protein n=1 Tax=Apostasia shenzhenica TaxID=1088818 RepID=A0A2I0B3L4_9ASPA|nr:hypothetical protein AXF42_Ash009263 [Apostasia shenzhenica]
MLNCFYQNYDWDGIAVQRVYKDVVTLRLLAISIVGSSHPWLCVPFDGVYIDGNPEKVGKHQREREFRETAARKGVSLLMKAQGRNQFRASRETHRDLRKEEEEEEERELLSWGSDTPMECVALPRFPGEKGIRDCRGIRILDLPVLGIDALYGGRRGAGARGPAAGGGTGIAATGGSNSGAAATGGGGAGTAATGGRGIGAVATGGRGIGAVATGGRGSTVHTGCVCLRITACWAVRPVIRSVRLASIPWSSETRVPLEEEADPAQRRDVEVEAPSSGARTEGSPACRLRAAELVLRVLATIFPVSMKAPEDVDVGCGGPRKHQREREFWETATRKGCSDGRTYSTVYDVMGAAVRLIHCACQRCLSSYHGFVIVIAMPSPQSVGGDNVELTVAEAGLSE